MTQNTGWSQGGNDGTSDATRPLQSVNGRPIYQNSGYQQAGYQTTQNAYSQAYPQNGYGYHATAAATSPTPEKSKRYGGGVILTAAVLAALVGGGVGAGVGSFTASAGSSSSSSSRGSVSSNISNSSTVTGVAETAKKALPSTVSIVASNGSTAAGGGSGVVLDKEGHVLTNNHVVVF